MPRRPAAPAPETDPMPDPLADLREPSERYPEEGQEGPQEGPEAPGEADPLEALILSRLEAAMAIPLDADGILTDDHRAMAEALATETADDLRPQIESAPAVSVEQVVERWHENTVALGFLHKGGRCGCTYIAKAAFGA